MMIKRLFVAGALLALVVPVLAAECPPAVKKSVERAHAGATIASCKELQEDGKVQYEAKITTKAGKKIDLDINPAGDILQTEESVALETVPAAVLKSLAAEYQGAKPVSAVRLSRADGKILYEIAFETGGAKKEATFSAAGKAVDEEEGEEEEDGN